MPNFNVQIPTFDGKECGGYLARADKPNAPGLVVIQEIFGVNAGMRQMCDEWAARGYNAVCPDIFWRQEVGVELSDKTESEWARAFELFKGFDAEKGLQDLHSAAAALRTLTGANGKVGSIGFCLGGKLAYMMGVHSNTDCNVSYYGVGLEGMLDDVMKIKKPMLLHIAEKDKFVSAEAQMQIRAAAARNDQIATYVYEGADHAFARVNGQHFNAAAAKAADERTRAFFKTHLG